MLLIPDTRGHENEIFTSLLMSELGFLSPRTFYTNVSINSGMLLFNIERHLLKCKGL